MYSTSFPVADKAFGAPRVVCAQSHENLGTIRRRTNTQPTQYEPQFVLGWPPRVDAGLIQPYT